MLLKNRTPRIGSDALAARPGFDHISPQSLSLLRWLHANKVEYILIGAIGRAVRGDRDAHGPVAIVPAPYRRNLERLSRALACEHAVLRNERVGAGASGASGNRNDAAAVKLTAEKLARGRRWLLRCGGHDLDIERAGRPTGLLAEPATTVGVRRGIDAAGGNPAPEAEGIAGVRYQELLYEANRFELSDGLSVEVASPEDLEHFSHTRRTGLAPEFRVTRHAVALPVQPGPADS
jgi:hypothetical protein